MIAEDFANNFVLQYLSVMHKAALKIAHKKMRKHAYSIIDKYVINNKKQTTASHFSGNSGIKRCRIFWNFG